MRDTTMHVGYVLKKFPRISETFILNEILGLQRHGVRVTVFSLLPPADGRYHRGLADLAEPIVYLPARKPAQALERLREAMPMLRPHRDRVWDLFDQLVVSGRSDVWSVLAWGLEIAMHCQRLGIDHLHAHFATVASHTARAACAAGVPSFSFTCHAKDIYRTGVDASTFSRLVRAASFAVTVCEANRDFILEHLAPGHEDRVRRLYNGVDLDLFHPRQRKPSSTPLIIGVGRLVEKKGFAFLIDAIAALRNRGIAVRCAIAGEGEDRARLSAQIAGSGHESEIELLGACNQDAVRAMLAEATALALPCVIGEDGNRDALPTVLLEALAMGVPAISTDVAGVSEILAGGQCGTLIPCGDPAALEQALIDTIGDEARQARMGRMGRAQAERLFDLGTNTRQLAEWMHPTVVRST